jgi:hypothetical protein
LLKTWFEEDGIKVTTDVRDSLGNVIANMNRNEWTVNRNFMLDRNFDKNSLEVIDNTGKVIFQVRVKGNQVRLSGVFFNSDKKYWGYRSDEFSGKRRLSFNDIT